VANFPLPIITGIGHERDESVLDMISNTRVKTPTAAATFLIEHLAQVYNRVQNASDFIFSYVRERMTREKMRIQHLGGRIPLMFSLVKTSHLRKLDAIESKLNNQVGRLILQQFQYLDRLQMAMLPAIQRKLNKEQYRLQMIEQQVMLLDPTLLLKRGYSITLLNGKVVKDASCLHVGDEIITRVENGEIRSIVK
jgi:exodeoxyribonuclease VII large subunit